MTRTFLLATAVAALSVTGCDRADETAISNETDNAAVANEGDLAGPNASAAAPVGAADFANMVAASDKFEIESGRLAADRATSAEVKSFAQMLVTEHQKSTAELKTAASAANPPLTPNEALDAEKQGMMSALQSASGADFDRQFIEQQITAHEKALSLLQNYAGGGDQESLRNFASKAATVVQGHLEKARALRQ